MKAMLKNIVGAVAPTLGSAMGGPLGNMGSDTRFDYSAIGDAVNLAARLESSTKEVGEDIVIGYDTISSSNFSDQIILKELESIFVKGKEKPIKIYTLQND